MALTLQDSPNSKINKNLLQKYMDLPFPEAKCQVDYIWIDCFGLGLRSKSRTLNFIPKTVSDCPVWIIDGIYEYFKVNGEDSDTYLTPVAIYPDPFRRGLHKLVLCATYKRGSIPIDNRDHCDKTMNLAKDQKPLFGLEQEYVLLDTDGRPLGWPKNGYPKSQNYPYPYFCGVGSDRVIAREVVEAHYRACIFAGIDLAGTNAEVALAQWEFQVGPTEGIKAADDLWVARYILDRITEEYGIGVTYDPKPVSGDWNGSGCHCNFSTESMRKEGGIREIETACEKLAKTHKLHLGAYDPKGGKDNERRLTGEGETSVIETFSYGIGNRSCSVRIPRQVANEGKGYLEDRRPASNCDPYLVCDRMVRTICLNDFT